MTGNRQLFLDQARRLHAHRFGSDQGTPREFPSAHAVVDLVEAARGLLFPHFSGIATADRLAEELRRFHRVLAEQVRRGLASRGDGDGADLVRRSQGIATVFIGQLGQVQQLLQTDVHAAYDGDPSLDSLEAAFFCSPGVTAVLCHRLAHLLFRLGVPIVPRIIAEHAHSLTGIDIHPGAQIGEAFFIDHGTGVVIGETAIIGDRVRLYQGVTLGARKFTKSADGPLVKGELRHPILEDDVVVYSGASILGRIRVGRGAVIGGNVWVTKDVAPGTLVTQAKVSRTGFVHGAGI